MKIEFDLPKFEKEISINIIIQNILKKTLGKVNDGLDKLL